MHSGGPTQQLLTARYPTHTLDSRLPPKQALILRIQRSRGLSRATWHHPLHKWSSLDAASRLTAEASTLQTQVLSSPTPLYILHHCLGTPPSCSSTPVLVPLSRAMPSLSPTSEIKTCPLHTDSYTPPELTPAPQCCYYPTAL